MANFLRIQILALMTAVAFYAIYAYAAFEGPIPGSEGVNAIGGWNVSNIQYSIESGSSKNLAVEFDLDGPANAVKVSVDSASGVFSDCVNTSGTHWYCVISHGAGISEFDQLRVVAG